MVHLAYRQLQAAPAGTTKRYYDASSPGSSLGIRSDAVPSGIVASRIFVLQKSGSGKPNVSHKSTQPPSILVEHDRDSTHIGFGRRVSSRFGQPAVQNPKPDEETSGANSHAFVGLNTGRKNHNEHHALVQPTLRMVRSSTQMQLLAQPQGDIPKKGLWKSKSHNTIRPVYNSLDTEVMEEIDPSGNKREIIAPTAIFPVMDKGNKLEKPKDQVKSRKLRTLTSDTSFVTTSSIRLQSVQDLFAEYGIDRPAGLVSKHAFRDTGNTVRLEKSPRKCHLCGWNNNSVYASCWRCGHNACSKCDDKLDILPQPSLMHNENPHKRLVEASRPTLPPVKRVEPAKVKGLAAPHVIVYSDGGMSSPSISSTLSTSSEPTMPRVSLQHELSIQTLREQGGRVSLHTGTKTTTKVKESPFLLADSQAAKIPNSHAQSGLSRRLLLVPDRRRAPHQLSREYQNDSSSSEDAKENAFGQPKGSPNEAHEASDNTVSLHARMYRVHEETDKGYAADTSIFGGSKLSVIADRQLQHGARYKEDTDLSTNTTLVDESSPPQSKRFQRLLDYTAKSESVPSPLPFRRPHSSQIWQHLSTFDKQVPEFVECRGYPRTGHTRHDVSAVDAGIVGECQHCLDDCSCASCQNTDHSVRCCTHPDHQAMVHIHHTPQKDMLTQDLIEFTTSLSKMNHLNSAPVSPRSSIAGPSIQQRTRDLLEKSKKACDSKRPVETAQPKRRFVEAAMNVGKSNPSIATGTSPPLFNHLDVFSRPSRNYMSDSDPNTNSLDSMPIANVSESTAEVDVGGRKYLTLSSLQLSKQIAVAGFEREPKQGRLDGQVTRRTITSVYNMVESGAQENHQPAVPSRTLLPALTAGRVMSKNAADKKAKLKLMERNMTPVDGNSEFVPQILTYGRRCASSGGGESRSCAGLSHAGEHQCVWKKRYIESLADRSHTRQAGRGGGDDVNISGITIVLHLEGREDLVVKAESWQGGKVSLDGRL